MKKYIRILFLISLLPLAFAGCSKRFLDERLYSSYAPETLTDSLGFEAAVVGLHNIVSSWWTFSDNQGWPAVWQVGTDIAWTIPTRGGGHELPYNDYNTLTSTDGAAATAWSWAYRTINNANNIIVQVENPDLTGMTQNNKNYINAEARFFRAFAYNNLATLFGRVPLITEPLKNPKTDFVRAPLDSVNDRIIEDLSFSAANLPDIDNVKNNAKGKMYARANKAMAQQLLAEVYLRSGKPELAEQQLNLIISSNKFNLTTARYGTKQSSPGDYFYDMFVYGNQRRNQGNREALWVIEMENPATVQGGITNSPQMRRNWGAAYHEVAGMKLTDSTGGRSNARMRVSNWVIYHLYEENDIRNSHYNFRRRYWYNNPASPLFGQPVPYAGNDTMHRLAPHPTKWYQFDPADEFGFSTIKDIIVMRLAETYLLLAEAQFKQNKFTDAANSINVIRSRANASLVDPADVDIDRKSTRLNSSLPYRSRMPSSA